MEVQGHGNGGAAMKANPINWFEIPVTDMARAKAFYEHVFDISMVLQDFGPLQMAWFPMWENAQGASGSLVKAESYVPSHAGTMVYFSVENIAGVLERVQEKGGAVLNPKKSVGDYGFVAHFEDSEGNRVALHSSK